MNVNRKTTACTFIIIIILYNHYIVNSQKYFFLTIFTSISVTMAIFSIVFSSTSNVLDFEMFFSSNVSLLIFINDDWDLAISWIVSQKNSENCG